MYFLGEVKGCVLLYPDEELLLYPVIYVSQYIPTLCRWELLIGGACNSLGRHKRLTSPTCDIESGEKESIFLGRTEQSAKTLRRETTFGNIQIFFLQGDNVDLYKSYTMR